MAQVFMPAAVASALFAGAIAINGAPQGSDPYSNSQDFAFMETVPVATEWLLVNKEEDAVCLVSKAQRLTASTSLINADATCTSVFPDIDLVSVWQQDKEGYLTLADEHGIGIAEFSWDRQKGFTSISGEPGKYSLRPSS